jgi:uncharacterized membrane protein
MNSPYKFIKTAVFAGAIVAIPLMIIIRLFADTFRDLMERTEPITANMAFGPFINTIIVTLIVLAGIVFVFFIIGLLLKTFWGQSLNSWLEKSIYEHIPLYTTFKQFAQRITGIENSNFPVVEVDVYGTGVNVLGIVVETLADERLMVYVPSSPVITVGQLFIVPKDRSTELDTTIQDMINCVSQVGLEAQEVYRNQ